MIIAAYAGAGKTTFAARFENAVDMVSMPRSCILSPKQSGKESEREKGRMDVYANPLYPDNYIADILRAEREYNYVLIPTSIHVVRRLREKYGRKVILCYPSDELKEEYRERFLARGNNEDFLGLFIGDWDRILGTVREYGDAVHIIMGAGECLTDLKERFDRELLSDDAKPVPEETIMDLEREFQSRRHNYVLAIHWRLWYRIPDILDPDERLFLAKLARRTYGGRFILPISDADEILPSDGVITDDKAQILEYLEQHD